MPRNGVGTFVPVASSFNPAVSGTVIESGSGGWEATFNDLVAGLTQSWSKDGQTVATGSFNMGGSFKITNMANGTAATDAATVGQLQANGGSFVTAVGGTADAITLTPSPAITAYAAGQEFWFVATGTNTTAVTVAVSGLAAQAVQADNSVLTAGTIVSGHLIGLKYDGTQFQIIDLKSVTTSSTEIPANILINGGMQVNQRVVTTGAADDTYINDRWNLLTQTNTVTISQQTLQENGTPTNVRITQSQASAQRFGIEQVVEAINCQNLRGQTVSFNARIRCSSSQAIRYAILEWTGTADSVTSDVVNDWTSASYTAGAFFLGSNLTVAAVGAVTPSAATWTTLPTLSATLSANCNNLIVFIWTEGTAAQNVTLDVSRAQCVVGSTLGNYIWEQIDTVLAACQRYYQKTFAQATQPAQNAGATGSLAGPQLVAASTANPAGLQATLPVLMRTTPAITLFNPFATNAQAFSNGTGSSDCSLTAATVIAPNTFVVTFTSPSGTAASNRVTVNYTADAEL